MRLIRAVTGGLLFGGAFAAEDPGLNDPECNADNDELIQCFTSSRSSASAYCTASITSLAAVTTVTVTPTVTVTDVVTAAEWPASLPTVTVTYKRKKKRGVCTKRAVKLDCLTSLGSVESTRFASACSCLGVAASTAYASAEPTTVTVSETYVPPQSCAASVVFSTITETPSASVIVSTITEVETLPASLVVSTITEIETETSVSVTEAVIVPMVVETVTATKTDTALSSHTTTVTDVRTETETTVSNHLTTITEPQTLTETKVSVSVSSATVTETLTITATAAASSSLVNGNFESNSLNGWSQVGSSGNGHYISIVAGGVGGAYALDIYTSYFINYIASSVVYGQVLTCVAGKRYRLIFNYAVVSNYANGNSWSVVLGGNTLVSGGGASVSWSTGMGTHTCGSTTGTNRLELRGSSNNNRAAHFQFDNFEWYPLEVAN